VSHSPQARPTRDIRIVAMYRLPDVARPRERIAGADLPEWAGVRAARPRFAGHDQPQLPGELGYCDVRDAAARDAQAALAREYGIGGFCYVFKTTVADGSPDAALVEILASGRPNLPFCVCWDTTISPNGATGYTQAQSVAMVRALLPAFADPRYLRIGGRPLLVVSAPDSIADVRGAVASWREECVRGGAGDPYLACYGTAIGDGPEQFGFEATIECPPLGGFPQSERERIVALAPDFAGDARNYRSYVGQMMVSPRPGHAMFRSVMPGWDETARQGDVAKLFVCANAETFGLWAERAVDLTRLRFSGDERLLFVRAWNEWEAGCHLEPDARHGRSNLEALHAASLRPPVAIPQRPSRETLASWAGAGGGYAAARVVRSDPRDFRAGEGSRVSVVMPAYNHERYVAAALDSVVAQSHANLEIIVVDDGSRDATGAILDDYAARCRTHAVTVVHQANAGAHEALNHGLALAQGEFVAAMNSDDLYAPDRLESMIAEMNRRDAGLGFSGTRFIDDEGNDIDADEPYARQLRKAIAEAAEAPDPLYVLVQHNISISTGNLIFRRELLERTGGFCAMRVCHDWDFVLAASYVTRLALVDRPLYLYRLHGNNTFHSARVRAALELEQLQTRFFSRIAEHPLLRDPQEAARFLDNVRRVGLGGFIRDAGRADAQRAA
jgi:glycosyltransferase involved in cell wall biosynthesis